MINIHHFGEQILDFLKANENFGLIIHISDERDLLLAPVGELRKPVLSLKIPMNLS